MRKFFTHVAGAIARAAGQPMAFIVAAGAVIIWGVTGPLFGFSDTWQLVINTGTTIITFLMVFLVQNSQNRDASAMQAKLDEIIRAIRAARADFIGIEHLTDDEIEKIRVRLERDSGKGGAKEPSHEAIGRMLSRHGHAAELPTPRRKKK